MKPVTDARMPPAALSALRAATHAHHERLDAHLPLSAPGATHADYLAHLRALRGWLAPLEARLWALPWPAALEAARRNGKEARIRHDLRLAAEPAPLQARDCGRLPGVSAPDAYALGVAYVIEGSQLGGAMLAKRFHLAAPLGGIASGPAPDRATAYTYLSGYGADTGVLWRRFLVFLDATVQTPAEIEAACRGAVDAFETLAAWLAAQGVLTVAGKPTVHAA